MNEIKKKQHYVPRMFLSQFADSDGKCWEYNLNSQKICKKRVEELCASNLLYEIRDENGVFIFPDGLNKVENSFSKLEDFYKGYLAELLMKIDGKCTVDLNEDDIEFICMWFSLLIVRNPLIKKAIPVISRDFGVVEMDEKSRSYNFISLMAREFNYFTKEMKKGHIQFLKCSRYKSYIITDMPVWIANPIYDGSYLPISSKYAIRINKPEMILSNRKKCEVKELNAEQTDEMNNMMFVAIRSIKVSEFDFGNSVIANDEYVLRHMLKTCF